MPMGCNPTGTVGSAFKEDSASTWAAFKPANSRPRSARPTRELEAATMAEACGYKVTNDDRGFASRGGSDSELNIAPMLRAGSGAVYGVKPDLPRDVGGAPRN